MRRPDPVELAKISIPVLAEAVAVILFLGACFVWMIVATTPGPT